MRIFVEDTFDTAHWLPRVPPDHKCHNLHGHTYRIRLEYGQNVNPQSGWVVDYAEIKAVWEEVKKLLDHKCLNDVIENSTCENLAMFIRDALYKAEYGRILKRIEIRETERCGVVLEC